MKQKNIEKKNPFRAFKLKDFVFRAVLSAAMTLAGGVTMPLVMHTTLFGLRNMVASPLYALFCAIGLSKVRKPGALSVIGLFSGAPLAFMSVVMFFNNLVAGILAELLMLLFFRNYQKKGAILFTAGIYMPLSLPVTLLFSMWLNGSSFSDLVAAPIPAIFTSIGTVILGFFGAFLGCKIAKELQKAGKLRPYGEDADA